MKMKSTFLALLLAAGLLGCGKQPEPHHIVILLDVSGSIDRQALEQAFKATDELVSRLKRGDRIAIIPILGDAQAEASGRIIRFDVPTARQAYDTDLRDFRAKLKASLEKMKAAAIAHPGAKTDILGTIALAEQEFQADPGGSKRLLAILSDFIQEDSEIDFRHDGRLLNQVSAMKFAEYIAKTNPLDFRGIATYLGLLRSEEYADLSRRRRAGIQTFWIGYFKASQGASRFATDGSGLLLKIAQH